MCGNNFNSISCLRDRPNGHYKLESFFPLQFARTIIYYICTFALMMIRSNARILAIDWFFEIDELGFIKKDKEDRV